MVWQRELVETEHMLADLYRQAFRNGSIRFILRRTGNIFLAGAGESGSATAAMLVCSTVAALNPPSFGNTTAGADASSGGSGSGSGTGSSASVKSAGASSGEKSASASAAASSSGRTPFFKKNSEMLGDDAQAQREKENAEMAELNRMRDELQMLLVAALVRMARRVYWSYMRQLWDLPPGDGMADKGHHNQSQDQGQGQGQGPGAGRTRGQHPPSPLPSHHEQCLASDRLKEESLVEMIRLRKAILAKTLMTRCLSTVYHRETSSRSSPLSQLSHHATPSHSPTHPTPHIPPPPEFGEEYKAADRVKSRLATAKEGLSALEAQHFNLLRNMKEVDVLEESISHAHTAGASGGDVTGSFGEGVDRGVRYGGAVAQGGRGAGGGGYTRCNGAAVNVGLLGVVLLDTVWDCWLMPDGLTPRGYSFEPGQGLGQGSGPGQGPGPGPGQGPTFPRVLSSTDQPHIEMSHQVISGIQALLDTNADHLNAAALSLALAPDAVAERSVTPLCCRD